MSKGEEKIARILRDAGVGYEREKTYYDLRHNAYRYDFYIPSRNMIIEFHGKQHYQYTSHFHKNQQGFKAACERDRKKISYALANHITMYVIPYYDIDSITNFQDLLKLQYKVSTKWHVDNDRRRHGWL